MTTFYAAKGGQASPAEMLVGLLFLGAVALITLLWVAIRGPAHYNVVVRNGAWYCPRCNRQVSQRRDHCRSCGYTFITYGHVPEPEHIREARARRVHAELENLRAEEAEEIRRRDEEREARRAERDAYYRSRGVEPGRWAWFYLLPDWLQPILVGIALAIPTAIVIAMAFRIGG